MAEERTRFALDDGRGEIWIYGQDVVSVKPLNTKNGPRLLLQMQGPEGQSPIWAEDTLSNRRNLGMAGGFTPKQEPEPEPGSYDSMDDEIPF